VSRMTRTNIVVWISIVVHWVLRLTSDTYHDSSFSLILPIATVVIALGNLLLMMGHPKWREVPNDEQNDYL
jgi:hypothetical protein